MVVHGVVELLDGHRRPRAAEDDVRHHDLVLEGRAEGARRPRTLVLDLSADARDRLDLDALEARDLDGRVEHVLDERRVFEDLEGVSTCRCRHSSLPHQLQLLHHAEVLVLLQHRSRRRDAELRSVAVQLLDGQQTCVGRHRRAVEGRLAVHVLRRVLDHPQTLVRVLHRVYRDRLEATPTV